MIDWFTKNVSEPSSFGCKSFVKRDLNVLVIIIQNDWFMKDISEPSSFGATRVFWDLNIWSIL
jgi:hypothetical protein